MRYKSSCEIFPSVCDKDTDGNVIFTNPNANVMEKPKPKTRHPHMYNVLLLNDDFTPMDFVVMVLQKVFNKEQQDAVMTMMEIHTKGKAIAGSYTFEVAEMKAVETLQMARKAEHPLQAILERIG